MKSKELLIVYNIYGFQENNERYYTEIDKILSHINHNILFNEVRLVISSVMKSKKDINEIKEKYGSQVNFFVYDKRFPVQVTFNKTVLSSILEFSEEYNGYLYISAGILLNDDFSLLPRLIEKNKTNKYGIIHLHVDNDNGPYEPINLKEDTYIELGYWCNLNITLFNKSLKEFYGIPMSDIFSISASESTYSYVSSALRKHYIIMGNSTCNHLRMYDSKTPNDVINEFNIKEGLMWGRTKESFLNDYEAIESGLGLRNEVIIIHNDSKYDENKLSIDERLKFAVRRNFFTNDDEVNYKNIKYEFL